MRSLRVHGQGSDKYDNVRIGMNGRLDTMQAAILLQKLTIFESELEGASQRRRALQRGVSATRCALQRLISGARLGPGAQYTIAVEDRDRVAAACKAAGVPTAVYYRIPLSQQTGYKQFPAPGGVPVAEELSRHVISLPMHPYLHRRDAETALSLPCGSALS